MKPADIIEVPINVIADMLISGEIRLSELTEEQIKQLPESVKNKVKNEEQ